MIPLVKTMASSKSALGASIIALFVCLAGCDQEAKLKEAQSQADERVAKAERDAKGQIDGLQKQIEALKANAAGAAAQAKSEAETAIQQAKASADEQAKIAEQAVARARAAYKAEAHAKLQPLEKDARELSVKAAKAPAKVKAAAGKAVKDIGATQKELAKDIAAFDTATLETFNKVKAKVEQDLAKLRREIQSARAKLP